MSLFPARLFKKIVAQEKAIQKYKAITNTMVWLSAVQMTQRCPNDSALSGQIQLNDTDPDLDAGAQIRCQSLFLFDSRINNIVLLIFFPFVINY